ncbi:MAG: restriction endonuclease subunit S [Anaerolineales bacterium]|nr:restriction endonuclease subunit S [Anaerolineales bacterium]
MTFNDWHTVRLADLIQSAQPGFATGERADDGVIQMRMNNVTTNGELDWSKFIRVPTTNKQVQKYSLKSGDVLFNSTNSPELVGKTTAFLGHKEPIVFSNHFLRLRTNGRRLDPQYLARWLTKQWQLRVFEKYCTQWVNQATVRKEDLLSLEIPLPPLDEQRRIAAILSRADRLRRLRRTALELSDGYLQSVFLEMFGELENYVPLGKLVTITGGGTPSRKIVEYYQGDIPWLTAKDMIADYISDTQEHVTAEAIKKSATKLVPKGSILVVVKSKVLMRRLPLAITKVPLCHGQDIKSIQCSDRIAPEFLVYVLKHNTPNLLNQARGANTEGLTLPMLREIQVPNASVLLQQKFASIVRHVERLRSQQREALRQAEGLFQALLHEAFQ